MKDLAKILTKEWKKLKYKKCSKRIKILKEKFPDINISGRYIYYTDKYAKWPNKNNNKFLPENNNKLKLYTTLKNDKAFIATVKI